jgi:rubrerythrin
MQDLQKALAVIRAAIHNEVSGQQFYNDASFHCIDLWAKDIFASLARDEEEHTRLLFAEYESLTTAGRWLDPAVAMAGDMEVDITRLTFADDTSDSEAGEQLFPPQWSAADAIDRRVDDLAALAFGIKMEEKAIALYRQEAGVLQDPAAKRAYEFLIEEETRHYHQLRDQWERLAGRAFAG